MSTMLYLLQSVRRLRGRAGLLLFVAAAAMIWWGLNRAENRADWLRVEAPSRAIAGQAFLVRVEVAPLAEAGFLGADLHWGATRDTAMQYLSTGGSQPVGKEGGTYNFEIMVAPKEGLGFVMGVIFFSRTGNWSDHELAASTELIPVVSNPAAPREARLEPLRLQPSGDVSPNHPHPATGPRLLTGLLFLVAMLAAWGASLPSKEPDTRPRLQTRWWQMLLGLLVLACLWELFGLESWLGERARTMARAGDLYYPRAVFQKAVISMAVAATVLFLLFIRRARRSHRLLFVSLAVYLAISAVNLVSLHVIDNVADLSWHGLTLVQALKLLCAAMTLQGVLRALRS